MSEYKFGELVKARLAELKMSQNELAKRVMKGRSYINYVVTGKNSTAKNKQSKPGVEAVELIAKELGIPAGEALAAAGWHGYVGRERAAPGPPSASPRADRAAGTSVSEDKALLDIANKAALEAMRQYNKERAANEIRIKLRGKMSLVLDTGGEELPKNKAEAYKQAFKDAFESVK